MSLKKAVDAARQHKNTPLESRLTAEQMKELHELAAMYLDGTLLGVSWRLLAEQMCDRWKVCRLQGETLKRNVLRLADDAKKSNRSSGSKKVAR